MEFKYSAYCTAYYVPSREAVCVYDEIEDQELQTIHADSEFHAELIMQAWENNAPEGIIAERL